MALHLSFLFWAQRQPVTRSYFVYKMEEGGQEGTTEVGNMMKRTGLYAAKRSSNGTASSSSATTRANLNKVRVRRAIQM